MRAVAGWLALLAPLVCCEAGWAQPAETPGTVEPAVAADTGAAAGAVEPATEPDTDDAAEAWAFGASVYAYRVPDDDDYLQPTVTADHGVLHLEARYNYEDRDTASAWIGYNFDGGDELAWEITPIAGVVNGDTDGVAVGYKGSLSWRRLELYSEGEYVFDADDSSDNFFYNWSELSFAATESLRIGMVTQRTRVYDAGRDLQRGLLVGFSFARIDLSAYWLDPGDDESTVVLGIGIEL